jgi:peroxiredoxin
MPDSAVRATQIWQWIDRCAFHCILGASLALNVYFGLRGKASPELQQSVSVLAAGARAPALYAEQIDGTRVTIDWAESSKPWILYVFSPSCVWCQRNENNFETIVRSHQSDHRIVGLSTTSKHIREYTEKHRLTYPVYANPDPSKSPFYAQAMTPTTYLISPRGIVLAVWRGAYSGAVKKGIEAKLNVQLPGLKTD